MTAIWTVVDADARVLRADYEHGRGAFASCVAIGASEDSFLLISPPSGEQSAALRDALSARGEVRALVAPNGFHRAGLPGALARWPEARVFAPERAVARVQQVCGAREVEPLSALQSGLPEAVELLVPPHLKNPDLVARVATAEGPIWYLNDLVLNTQAPPPQLALRALLWALGFRQGVHVNRFGVRFVLAQDRAALKAWLLAELERAPPRVVVFGHGPPISEAESLQLLLDRIREEL